MSDNSLVLFEALGSNNYNIYYGGKAIASNITVASAKPCFRISGGNNTCRLYVAIDDIRYNKTDL